MPKSSRLRFGGLYAALCILTIAGETIPVKLLLYGCKPLLMLSLMGYLYVNKPAAGFSRSLRWLFIGLFFALAGDVFLMIQEADLFAAGLASFLVMQVCYSIAFRYSVTDNGASFTRRRGMRNALPFLAYLAGFLYLLYDPLLRNPATAPLWIPVVVYVLCISTMSWMATLRRAAAPTDSYRWVLVGALLFMASDSLIAINKFIQPIPASAWLILGTYAAAQYGIVRGMLRQIPAKQQPADSRIIGVEQS
ncbi:lysoplasmalogenase [Nibrella saemangeumensis]|uniref:Lysoplasmalogenase n=1 Tax=Nibrella saemangeumensis TaxID=1084526 RepID=A0ABP8N2H7_9BACT